MYKNIFILLIAVLISGCSLTKTPQNEVVQSFEVNKFYGDWYEIARMDEDNGNKNVHLNYSPVSNGIIIIKKSQTTDGAILTTNALAEFNSDSNVSSFTLKTDSDDEKYDIVKIDPFYQYALIYGKPKKQMWIIARKTAMPEVMKVVYTNHAKSSGYDTDKLIWTIQE
ncbi:MAG: lipocalin family protein [Campylobacter sp.]|nr:lipocalin family protein [Campylobacter sp.]